MTPPDLTATELPGRCLAASREARAAKRDDGETRGLAKREENC
jgi:hypothetical protein